MNVGMRLRELREAKGLSQGDTERRSGLLRSYISRVEGGHTTPSLQTLEKFAKALEVEPYELLFHPHGRRQGLRRRSRSRRKVERNNWQSELLRNLVAEGYGHREAETLVDLAAS